MHKAQHVDRQRVLNFKCPRTPLTLGDAYSPFFKLLFRMAGAPNSASYRHSRAAGLTYQVEELGKRNSSAGPIPGKSTSNAADIKRPDLLDEQVCSELDFRIKA